MTYRGYELEQKTLMVGWQITITKDGTFVRNGSVTSKLATAMDDAHEYIDGLLVPADLPPVSLRARGPVISVGVSDAPYGLT